MMMNFDVLELCDLLILFRNCELNEGTKFKLN